MTTVAILQSNYIPWKGYFDLIAAADDFIFYDDVQFTKNDWRNRNQIKTARGAEWLSVPVGQNISRTIREVELKNAEWQITHWRKLEDSYRKAPHFAAIAQWLAPLYLEQTYRHLSQMNRTFIEAICGYVGIATRFHWVWDFPQTEGKTERLVDLCARLGASRYLSGPAAREYLEVDRFEVRGIAVDWFDYSGYRPYTQMHGEFVHNVSIVDLLFNCGPEARHYLKAFA